MTSSPPFAIRLEAPGDQAAIRAIHLAAFPSDGEANLVDALRADGDVIISLVIEVDGEAAGHALFSQLSITRDGDAIKGAAFAPLAVLEQWQRQGLAAALIWAGLDRLRGAGYDVVIVLGDPDYYGRFGFSAAVAEAFPSVYSGVDEYQALELTPGIGAAGPSSVTYPPAFAAL